MLNVAKVEMIDKNQKYLSSSDLIDFILLYKKHECLWNFKLDSYKKPELRGIAISSLSEKFDVTNEYVKKKIHNLRTTYLHERKKIIKKHSLGQNDDLTTYSSNLSWFKYMNFLEDVIIPRKKTAQVSDDEVEAKTIDSKENIEWVQCGETDSWDKQDVDDNVETIIDSTEIEETTSSPTIHNYESPPRSKKRKQTSTVKPDNQIIIENNIPNNSAFADVTQTSSHRRQPVKSDYLESFGNFMIEGLKTIPSRHKRDKLMQDILQLYFSAKLNSHDDEKDEDIDYYDITEVN